MILSTYARIIGFSFLFLLIIVPGWSFFSSERIKNTSTQHVTANPALKTGGPIFDAQDNVETPVIQVASLSLGADLPLGEFSNDATRSLTADDRIIRAKTLANKQKFNEALDVLDSVQNFDENHYRVQLLKARILSWSGKNYEAEQTFIALAKQYPQDPDITVSHAYLHLYQSNFSQAEQLFTQVLTIHPDYQDAKNGLNRAMAARVE